MMKRLTLLLLLLALPAQAEVVVGHFMSRYDLDATTITYCRSEGQRGDPFAPPKPNDYLVDNAGSVTAVTSATAGQDVFLGMGTGDMITITVSQVDYPRGILTYTDTENIVVDEAIDLSASDYKITWRENKCGTAATDGWLDASNLINISVFFYLTQYVGDGNGLDVRIEAIVLTPDGTENLVQVWPDKAVAAGASVQNFTTAGITSNLIVNITAPVQRIRVGVLHNTADDGNDLTTNAEQISAVLFGYRQR
jgi:hypothetical protein